MTIAFAGDFLPRCPLDWATFPAGVKLIANLECAISDVPAKNDKAYSVVLNGEAEAHVARSRFAAVNLANNHVCDAGTGDFERMRERLDRLPNTQLYGTTRSPFAVLEDEGCRCAVIGCMGPSRSRGPGIFKQSNVLRLIRDLAKCHDRVFVTPHWGREGEYASHPSPRQQRLARQWIQAGAHGVFGHHAHSIHGRQQIEGRPVYYSLGNLAFDHEEGRQYPLTAFGLMIAWTAGAAPSTDRCEEIVLWHKGGRHCLPPPELHAALREYLDAISDDLTSPRWGWLQWARAVGAVYIPKSEASWQRRAEGPRGRKARMMRQAWRRLPLTMLLRWGCRHPDAAIRERAAAIEEKLRFFGGVLS